MELSAGPTGVIHNLDFLTGREATRLARPTEELGYGALWIGEVVVGRDPFALVAHLLGNTSRLVIGTSAANVWKRDPLSMIGAARTLAELYGDRFVLGVGVSHEFLLTRYKVAHQKPLTFMRRVSGDDEVGALPGSRSGRGTTDRAGGAVSKNDCARQCGGAREFFPISPPRSIPRASAP